MSFIQNLLFKLVISKKEQIIALALKALYEGYEEHKDEFAAKVVGSLPERIRRTAHPEEVIHLLEVLEECSPKIAAAAAPLFVE